MKSIDETLFLKFLHVLTLHNVSDDFLLQQSILSRPAIEPEAVDTSGLDSTLLPSERVQTRSNTKKQKDLNKGKKAERVLKRKVTCGSTKVKNTGRVKEKPKQKLIRYYYKNELTFQVYGE